MRLSGGQYDSLLLWLLRRGDRVSICSGRLVVSAASGKPVPDDWIEREREKLATEISALVGKPIFQVFDHSVGNFDGGKFPGVNFQLKRMGDRSCYFTIFNVETVRKRNTRFGKKGQPLPSGQFWIGEKHALFQFWQSTGLPVPKRKGSFADYLGKLRSLYLTGLMAGEKIKATSLAPVEVTYDEIAFACTISLGAEFSPDNFFVSAGHFSDNGRTMVSDKQLQQRRAIPDSATFSSTSRDIHGKSNQGGRTQVAVRTDVDRTENPVDQSVDEWVAAYEDAPSL